MRILRNYFILILLFVGIPLFSQIDPPPPPPPPQPGLPIDAGISVLLIAGSLYGAFKLRK